jgi:hypothetical protein
MTEQLFPGWPEGLNNIAREDLLTIHQLRKALNIDLLPGGHPSRREGYTKLLGDGEFHSLYATPHYLVFVKDGDLCITKDAVQVDVVALGVGTLSGVLVNDEFYFSDGKTTGILSPEGQLRPLGIVSPSRQPFVSAASEGGLYEGRYQVAITYLAADGRESGTGQAKHVFVPEGGGIALFDIPQPEQAEVVAVRIYVSDPDGDGLYFRTQITVGQSSFTLGYMRGKKRLNTQFLQAVPAGRHLQFFNGRLYVAVEGLLIFSEAMNFGQYHSAEGYLMLASAIKGAAAVDGGIFVSDQTKVVFLSGQKPEQFQQTTVHTSPAQEGTMTVVDGGLVNDSLSGSAVAVWWAEEGHLVLGYADGTISRVKEADIAIPKYERGTVAEVHRQGVKQLVSVMKNPGMRSSTAFEDSATIEVRRNGIEI